MDRRRRGLLAGWLAFAAITAVLYALPLDQDLTDHASNGSFVVGAVALSVSALLSGRKVEGLDRWAWYSIGVTLIGATVVFAADPAESTRSVTAAMFVAPVVAAAVVFAILAFGRHALGTLGVTRLLFDGLWLTSGLAVLTWAPLTGPLVDSVDSIGQLVVYLCFPVIAVSAGAITGLLWPHSAGSARRNLVALGGGAAITGLAGAIHLRLGLEGTLRFGTAYDYLWTVGIGLLGVATLDPAMGLRLRSRTPPLLLQQVLTVFPALSLAVALVSYDRRPPLPLAISLLALLTIRVVVATAAADRLQEELRRAARYDELTGLLNRRAIFEKLSPADLDDTELTVLYLDLDGFKAINDTHGHAAGDVVLAEIGRRLRSAMRADDWVARLGGDEFLVVSRRAERGLAERLHVVVSRPVLHDGRELRVGCSIGVSRGQTDPSTLIERADRALYEAKASGRDRVVARVG